MGKVRESDQTNLLLRSRGRQNAATMLLIVDTFEIRQRGEHSRQRSDFRLTSIRAKAVRADRQTLVADAILAIGQLTHDTTGTAVGRQAETAECELA